MIYIAPESVTKFVHKTWITCRPTMHFNDEYTSPSWYCQLCVQQLFSSL